MVIFVKYDKNLISVGKHKIFQFAQIQTVKLVEMNVVTPDSVVFIGEIPMPEFRALEEKKRSKCKSIYFCTVQ